MMLSLKSFAPSSCQRPTVSFPARNASYFARSTKSGAITFWNSSTQQQRGMDLGKMAVRSFSNSSGGIPINNPPWVNPQNQVPGQHLEQYGVDLTKLAKEGKLDPVIGRHEEIRRTLQILARRTKNNPVLIGEVSIIKVLFFDTNIFA
jgi:ATP-dependent Clp protease ATP-binding subunit ClpA